jgi:hypothetical protein
MENPMTELTPSQPPPVTEARWNLALLRQLDWKRMQELVSMLLHRAGMMAEIAWIRPDGCVVLSVAQPRKGGRVDALVQCPPWAVTNVDTAALTELYDAIIRHGASRGIFITAGGFSEEARAFVRTRPLEIIDGRGLLRTILRMTEPEQAYHLRMITVGPYTVPTCPSCGGKLALRTDSADDPRAQARDLTFRERQTVDTEISCRTLTVKSGADVHFLRTVRAHDVVVQGRAHGNITVQGKLTVGKGGVLSGFVAARTIAMKDGGVLEAEASVLNADEIQPVRALPSPQVWRCPSWPKCRGQLPLRQGNC